MDKFDYQSIQFPADVDYEELYKYLKENNGELERLVDQILAKDEKWLERVKQLEDIRDKRHKLMEEMNTIETNNKQFDELIAEIKEMEANRKSETICDKIYFDKEYTYYPKPIQRVIDIEELKKRMNSLSVENKTEKQSSAKDKVMDDQKPTTSGIKKSSVGISTESFTDCDVVYDGLKTDIKTKPLFQKIIRTPLKPNDRVFAASNNIVTHIWKPGKIESIRDLSHFSVKFDDKYVVGGQFLSHRLIAYSTKSSTHLTVGERVIANFMENTSAMGSAKALYSGTVAEPPKNTNRFRHLIFFDKNGYRYVESDDIFLIYEKCPVEKFIQDFPNKNEEEVQQYIDFLRKYMKNYPERPMLRLQKDDKIKVRYKDKWESVKVLEIDASLALIKYDKYHLQEWIYRGSRRLLDIYKECSTAKTNVKHLSGRSTTRISRRLNQPSNAFVEWNNDDQTEDDMPSAASTATFEDEIQILDKNSVASRKRKLKQTARKSTAKPPPIASSISLNATNMIDSELSNPYEVDVEKMPEFKRELKPFIPHTCCYKCVEDVDEKRSFYDENPYHIPIIVGYRREIVRYSNDKTPQILYRAPCGRRLRNIYEIYKYLLDTGSVLDIDLFTFSPGFALFRRSNPVMARLYIPDISNGLESQPISCVNSVDNTDLGNVVYRNVRFPHPKVHFKPDSDFLSCCDCTDNCRDSESCACQQLTIEANDAMRKSKYQSVSYQYKRLNDFVLTGTFECNEKCRCNSRCPNRVVQNGIKCRLQLFKTLKKGWGVRVLHDVPKGAFLCIYAAEILNEEAADEKGKKFGDEYLADLDYIDVCEHNKEGYESDVEEDDDDYDQSDDDYQEEDDDDDEDYKYCGKRPRVRDTEVTLEKSNIICGVRKRNDDKSRVRYSIREDFYNEDFCYSLDAKKMGNIGRYLNHSCEPNCFVQNVFVDTHDLRFPWVSFFAKKDILAYEELTWDYNYEIGSIPDRKMPCYCGANRCKKRLL